MLSFFIGNVHKQEWNGLCCSHTQQVLDAFIYLFVYLFFVIYCLKVYLKKCKWLIVHYRRGYFCQNCLWMWLPDPENLTFSISIFCTITHPSVCISFLKEKHPVLLKLGAFCHNLLKIHPIYVIWAPSSLMKTRRSLYQISRNSIPKGRHRPIYVYHVNVRTPREYTVPSLPDL